MNTNQAIRSQASEVKGEQGIIVRELSVLVRPYRSTLPQDERLCSALDHMVVPGEGLPTMPQKLLIDWGLAFDLFSRGLTYKDIAPKVGCKEASLRQYGCRHKWSQRVSQAREAVSEVVHSLVTREPLTVQKRAEKWVEREINAVEKLTDVLDSTPIPQDIKGIREHVEVRAMNGKYGRSTFGLDNQGQSITLNVGLVSRGDLMPTEEQVIDVESAPAPVASTITST